MCGSWVYSKESPSTRANYIVAASVPHVLIVWQSVDERGRCKAGCCDEVLEDVLTMTACCLGWRFVISMRQCLQYHNLYHTFTFLSEKKNNESKNESRMKVAHLALTACKYWRYYIWLWTFPEVWQVSTLALLFIKSVLFFFSWMDLDQISK